MKSYTFGTPEGLEITVDIAEDRYVDGAHVRGYEINITPPPGFEMFTPAVALLSNGDVNLDLTARHELGGPRFWREP